MTAIANYNLIFDNGHFIKNCSYKYREHEENLLSIFVTTEEGIEQELSWGEFNIFFTIKNNIGGIVVGR